MILLKSITSAGKKIALTLIIIITFSVTKAGIYENAPDTGKKVLLASLEKKKEEAYITLPANVVYPSILNGNEKQSLEYVGNFSENRRDYLIRTYAKGKKFFTKAATILKKYNIAEELKVLLALESAFNGNAVSKAGAVGYWQFMDATAKQYGLRIAPKEEVIAKAASKKQKAVKVKVKKVVDDRKNFDLSTKAAALYFRDCYRNLKGDWLLIVASYNCGIGNVWQAMKTCGKTDPDFWDVKNYLPAETRAYVMNFIAMNVIFNNYDAFLKNTLRFEPLKVKASDVENTTQSTTDDVITDQ